MQSYDKGSHTFKFQHSQLNREQLSIQEANII